MDTLSTTVEDISPSTVRQGRDLDDWDRSFWSSVPRPRRYLRVDSGWFFPVTERRTGPVYILRDFTTRRYHPGPFQSPIRSRESEKRGRGSYDRKGLPMSKVKETGPYSRP